MRRKPVTASLVLALCALQGHAGASCTLDQATGTSIDSKPFLVNAYGSRWNAANNLIAYMQPNTGGYYRLFTVNPDGTGRKALDHPILPVKHRGAAYWHPSGRFLILVAQKQEWSGPKLFGNPDYEALPGFGRHDDL